MRNSVEVRISIRLFDSEQILNFIIFKTDVIDDIRSVRKINEYNWVKIEDQYVESEIIFTLRQKIQY